MIAVIAITIIAAVWGCLCLEWLKLMKVRDAVLNVKRGDRND